MENDEDEDWGALESSAVTLNKSAKEAAATSGINKKYEATLQQLNDYLKTFNPQTYREIEVKEGKVYFGFTAFSQVYQSYIPISELKQNTTVVRGSSISGPELKIMCKGNKDCFYSTYSKGGADHFRFFSNTVKDLTKIEQLVNEFIKSL